MTQILWGGEAAGYINPQTGTGAATGANVTTETQIDRDAYVLEQARAHDRALAKLERAGITAPVTEEVVPVDAGTRYVTEQTEPPIKVGTIRGLIAGVAGALITGLTAAVTALANGSDNRAAVLAGAAGALAGLTTVVAAFAGYGYADQASRAREV